MRILVVDDDEDILEVLSLILGAEGHQVSTAGDGLEALNRMRAGDIPQLILLDLMMPRMDGETMVRQMREVPRLTAIPIVVISGDPTASEKARQLGATDCLVKPIELEELTSVLRRVETRAAIELEDVASSPP